MDSWVNSKINDKHFTDKIHSSERPSLVVQTSVYLMVIGAVIASLDDLSFNAFGYIFLSVNNLFTAAQGVVSKQKLSNKVNRINEFPTEWIRLEFEYEWPSILQFIDCSWTCYHLGILHWKFIWSNKILNRFDDRYFLLGLELSRISRHWFSICSWSLIDDGISSKLFDNVMH